MDATVVKLSGQYLDVSNYERLKNRTMKNNKFQEEGKMKKSALWCLTMCSILKEAAKMKRFAFKLGVGAFAAVGLLLSAMPIWATPYAPAGPFVTPGGPFIPPPHKVPGKTISTHTPGTWGSGDRGVAGLSPEQNLNWDGTGGTANGNNYSGSRAGDSVQREVDALANHADVLYFQVIADAVALLFSVDADPNIYFEPPGTVGPPCLGGQPWADQSLPCGSQPDGTPGSDIDDMTPVRDTDGLEVWGPEPSALDVPPFSFDDADRYSLESPTGPFASPGDTGTGGTGAGPYGGVPDPLGVSVWAFAGGVSSPLWLAAEIAAIVGGATGLGGQVNENDINLDGMMTSTSANPGGPIVDHLMFTIDPIAGFGIDGGEIFVASRAGGIGGALTLAPTGPCAAGILFHGGHCWDTAFAVAATYGLARENVNALEAVAAVPEPGTLLLLGTGLVALVGYGRRKPA